MEKIMRKLTYLLIAVVALSGLVFAVGCANEGSIKSTDQRPRSIEADKKTYKERVLEEAQALHAEGKLESLENLSHLTFELDEQGNISKINGDGINLHSYDLSLAFTLGNTKIVAPEWSLSSDSDVSQGAVVLSIDEKADGIEGQLHNVSSDVMTIIKAPHNGGDVSLTDENYEFTSVKGFFKFVSLSNVQYDADGFDALNDKNAQVALSAVYWNNNTASEELKLERKANAKVTLADKNSEALSLTVDNHTSSADVASVLVEGSGSIIDNGTISRLINLAEALSVEPLRLSFHISENLLTHIDDEPQFKIYNLVIGHEVIPGATLEEDEIQVNPPFDVDFNELPLNTEGANPPAEQ